MLSSLCCSVVIMLHCYCVALLLFVLSYVLIVCTVPLPPGVNPIAVDKHIISYYCLLQVPNTGKMPMGRSDINMDSVRYCLVLSYDSLTGCCSVWLPVEIYVW